MAESCAAANRWRLEDSIKLVLSYGVGAGLTLPTRELNRLYLRRIGELKGCRIIRAV
jgi:hypothetical protein